MNSAARLDGGGGRIIPLLMVAIIVATVLGFTAALRHGDDRAGAADPVAMYKNPQAADLWLCDEEMAACAGTGQGEVTIEEEVANIPAGAGLGAFAFRIYYSTQLVDLVITEGPFLGSTGRETDCFPVETENWVSFQCTSTGGEAGPTGSGTLAYIKVIPKDEMVFRPTAGNGILVRLLDDSFEARLADVSGEPIAIGSVGSATILVQALEGDINYDCEVNVIDEQSVSVRYGTFFGISLYNSFFDLEPSIPDFDIDIKDLQFIYGRDGSSCEEPLEPEPTPTATATPGGPTETPTATVTPGGETPTPTASATPVPPTATPTWTPATATATPTASVTPTPSAATPTFTPSAIFTPSAATPTLTPSVTATPGGAASPTAEPGPRRTRTPAPGSATATATAAGGTPTPTATAAVVTVTPTPAAPSGTVAPVSPGREAAPIGRERAEGLPGAGSGLISGGPGASNALLLLMALLAVSGWALLAKTLGDGNAVRASGTRRNSKEKGDRGRG